MAIARNVRVKVRLSALESEINLKGGLDRRPGREGAQQKVVVDAPVIEIPLDEYNQRKADINKVLFRGWQLIEDDPPEIWMGSLLHDGDHTVTMHAKVVSNNVATTCGFQIDIQKDFSTALTATADESPVQDVDSQDIHHDFDVTLYSGWTFYIRPYATDGTKTVYGHVKSVEIP